MKFKMPSILLIMILNAFVISADKLSNRTVILRNGAVVSAEKFEKVWQGLQKIQNLKDYYWLYSLCKYCKHAQIDCSCDVYSLRIFSNIMQKIVSQKTIQEFDDLGITSNGIADRQTQDIVISSYCGSGDPKFVRMRNPRRPWFRYFK